MTVKSSISLTDEQDAFARQLVEKGRFPSVSAALQQGVELSLNEIKSFGRNKFSVALLLVVLAGYVIGKDLALRDNARDAASLEQCGGQ